MKKLLFVLGISVLFFSCSRTEPKIAYGYIELVYYQGETRPEEKFSFFVIPEDEDGLENLSELILYHDREGLSWRLSPEDWIKYEGEGQTWIGSRGIAVEDEEILPRGQYRAVLINKGGEKSERSFSFDTPESPHPFPFFEISGGMYRIDSEYPVHHLICYDGQGNNAGIINLQGLEGPLSDLRISGNVRSVALWAEDPAYRTSALTDVASLR